MKKDDESGPWTKAAFGSLCVISFGVLVFSLKRLYTHVSGKKKYKPLITFYCILSVFLLCKRYAGRVIYFLDIAFHYPVWLYDLLNILPIELIFCASTLISYIWCQSLRREIAIEFSPLHALSKDSGWKANQRNLSFFAGVNTVIVTVFTVSYMVVYTVAQDQVLLCLSIRVMRIEDIALSLGSSIIIYVCGLEVTNVIRGLMRRDPPSRFLIVKTVSIASLCLRAAVNTVFLALELSDIEEMQDDWLWGLVLFFFYFIIELMLLLVLLALVYAQVKAKKKLKPRGGECYPESLNAVEIDRSGLPNSQDTPLADSTKSFIESLQER